MKRLGIALSGGGARGGAHVGALNILQDSGIQPEFIAGTSCGAIVGAFYAAGLPLDRQLAFSDHLRWRSLRMLGMPRLGFFHSGEMERLLVRYLGPLQFSDLRIPLAILAADFRTARPVVFREGSVARALSASAAIPVIFSPVMENDQVLVDGGVVDNLPTQIVRGMGADVVMAINVVTGFSPERRYRNLFDMAMGTLDLLVKESTERGSEAADLCLVPRVSHVHPSDLGKVRHLIEAGEQSMKEALPELRALLDEPARQDDLRTAG